MSVVGDDGRVGNGQLWREEREREGKDEGEENSFGRRNGEEGKKQTEKWRQGIYKVGVSEGRIEE